MRVASFASDVVVWAPAKVNLFLEILRKRPDGYHDLATFMAAVNLHDTLVFQPAAAGLAVKCNWPDLSVAADNLVVKAAQLIREQTGCQKGVAVRLIKRIPMQGGLGGGSSDAAATLAGLNRLWDLGLKLDELANLGARLGSDVAFFVKTEAAWCSGRGEIVAPASLARTLDLVLICPPFGCATPAVYQGLSVPDRPMPDAEMRQAIRQGDIDAIGRHLHNRLSESAQRLAPRLEEYLEKLRSLGPVGVLLSGSGSSVFALCRGRHEARQLARAYARGPVDKTDKVYVVRSRASPLPP